MMLQFSFSRLLSYKPEPVFISALKRLYADYLVLKSQQKSSISMFQLFDLNHTNLITADSLLELNKILKITTEDLILQAFKKVDINGSGSLEYNEFQAIITDFRTILDKDIIRALFYLCDRDRNESIDEKNFKDVCKEALEVEDTSDLFSRYCDSERKITYPSFEKLVYENIKYKAD